MSERGDSCFPSTRKLADETGLARSTVILALDGLEAAGFLHVIRPKTKGRGRYNRYEARVPEAVRESVRRSDISLEEVSDSRRLNVRWDPKKGPTVGPEDVKLLGRQEDVTFSISKPEPLNDEQKAELLRRIAEGRLQHEDRLS